jgi:ArsR family transcriptional regulator, cadmium/lead-responsive transcriptional repressor
MQASDGAITVGTAPFRLPEEPAPVDVLAKYFRAFGDPTRLSILDLLAERERSVGEIVEATGQSQPNISNHLGCLRWCGFVVARRERRSVYYAIADDRVISLLELARSLLADNEGHVACCTVLSAEQRRSRARPDSAMPTR